MSSAEEKLNALIEKFRQLHGGDPICVSAGPDAWNLLKDIEPPVDGLALRCWPELPNRSRVCVSRGMCAVGGDL